MTNDEKQQLALRMDNLAAELAGLNKRYQNLTKSDLKAAFKVFTNRSQEK